MLGTLQWAIRKSIDDGTASEIVFNIPGSGPHTITMNYELPTIIKGNLTIDATTQPDYQGSPLVIIDGQNEIERGLYFHDYSNYTVKGLGIQNFTRRGILFEYAYNILAEHNVITEIHNNDPDHTATAIRVVGNPKVGHSDAIIRYNYFGTNTLLNPTLGCNDAGILVDKNGNNNLFYGNTIGYNHQAGIYINGAQENKISQNLIFGQNIAISLLENANNNKAAPDSLQYNDTTQILSGVAIKYDTIEIFGSTGAENANEFLTTTVADVNGHWQVPVFTTQWDYFVVTTTDINGNTSPFSKPLLNPERSLSIGTCQPDSLPITVHGGFTPGDTLLIDITLPNDISALNHINIGGNATLYLMDITLIHKPHYEIITDTGGNDLSFYYFVYAGCDVFSATTQGYQNYIEINNNGAVQYDTTDYNINSPVIIFVDSLSQNMVYDAHLSFPFQRRFYYVNTSTQGNFSGVIEFKDSTISPTAIEFLSIGFEYAGNYSVISSDLTDSSITSLNPQEIFKN